jgi:hypothetical protein
MNDRYGNYTLGRFRSDVFRVLDEYSCNGKEHEIFSGAVGDMEKRFITAANSAIRLVSLSSDRKLKSMGIVFKKPHILMLVCDFSVLPGGEKEILIPEGSASLSFDFCGECVLSFCDEDAKEIEQRQISSSYGQLSTFKSNIPENCAKIIFTCGEKSFFDVKRLKSYSFESVGYCSDEKLLPDGKKLYSTFSPECIEIARVNKICGNRVFFCRNDIFEFSDGVLSCDEKNAGTYSVEYFCYPAEISESSCDDEKIELTPAAFSVAVYATAAELCEREDGELYARLTYKYREILANCYPARKSQSRNRFYSGCGIKRYGIKQFFG